MEGVMMKNQDKYAIAVRKPDKEIIVEVKDYKGIGNDKLKKLPLVRGVVSFLESLSLGLDTLMFSASFFEDEEEDKEDLEGLSEEEIKKKKAKDKKKEDALMGATLVFSVVLAVALFMLLPYVVSLIFEKWISSGIVIAALEGLIRLVVFIGYIAGISKLEDIHRVYQYHGAEHKCINCIESGLELTVENVRKSSKEHKRCGTSFLLFVMLVSIILFMFIQVDSRVLRLVIRILLIPVIAGISYEFIRLAGKSDNAIVNIISKPGLWMQRLTTIEPEDEMIEVGIASVEAVFDWRAYIKEINEP